MSNKIRWGILSTARINRSLLDPIKEASRSELAAVASRDLDRAKAYAAEKGIPQAYGSYEELLADPNIDVIYNPLPNALHCEWTVKAAEAGKHVLCEKPLVTSLEELDKVEAAAQANKVTIFEAFMYLHHPQTLRVKEMVQSGQIGELQLINSWFNFYLPPEDSRNIRLNPDLEGGSLWDVGVYPNSLSIVMAHAGAPLEVWASQRKGETGVEVGLAGQLRFANGVVAQISSGFRTPFRQVAYLVGSEGILEITEPWKPGAMGSDSLVRLTRQDNTEALLVTPAMSPYLTEVAAMEACILDGADPVVSLTLSRDFLRSILALYESARTGKLVLL
jgi:predicted dehydrogenase